MIRTPTVAGHVAVEKLAPATYNDIQDWLNNTQSAGYVEGGEISNAGSGKINVTAMRGFIKTTNSEIATTKSFNLAAQTALDILDNKKINYVYVKFTAPATIEVLATTTREDIELNRQFTLGRVYRDGTTLHIRQSGVQLANFIRKEHERLYEVRFAERASGLIITDDEDRSFDLSAGVFYAGRNRVKIESAMDTSSDYFTYWSWISNAWYNTAHDQTKISDRQYNNVSGVGVLSNLTNNRYGVHWVFLDLDGHIQVLYGQGDYKLTEAQDAALPSSLPDFLQDYCLLVGRIIKKEEVDAFTEIVSAYQVFFPTTLITDHGELGGLDDDDHAEVYLAKENETAFTPDGNYEPATKKYVDDSVAAAGGGDMTKAVYDTDDDSIVDKAENVDDGAGNSSSAANVKSAVDLKHTQGTDQKLDDGGANEVTAVNAKDAVSKKHTQNTDTHLGTVDQDISLNTHKLTGVTDPVDGQDAATKQYVDDNAVTLWEVDGTEHQLITADEIDMQSKKIINVTDPTANQDAATKKYITDNYTKDHGSLDGLSDDDHPQYSNLALQFHLNLITNWYLEADATGYSKYQASAMVADTAHAKYGVNSLKVTNTGGSGAWCGQDINTRYYSKEMTFGAWIWCATASRARLNIWTGSADASSSYHSGGGSWEWLSVTATIHSAGNPAAQARIASGDQIDAWFDGWFLIKGSALVEPPDEP